MSLKKVSAKIKEFNRFLITTHRNPEGDAIGSQLALSRLLRKIGKRTLMINEDDLPSEYSFLPGVEGIKKFKGKLPGFKFDCVFVLDCSDLNRCREVSRAFPADVRIINIDHHISNEKFGAVNWVEPGASSCAEMIYKIYKKLKVPLDRAAAMQIYAGVFSDTGSFRYSNTTAFTHQIAAELLKYKLDVVKIYNHIYGNILFSDSKLLAGVMARARRAAAGKIIWFEVRQDLLKTKSTGFDLAEHVLSFGRAVRTAEVVLLFRENLGDKNEIRVNFRSQGKVDVNRIARIFGGGGHKAASGATVKGNIAVVRRRVLSAAQKAIREIPS